jgi:regulator of protease activity HflC (stomatin/prohibitin superfamily)
MASMTSGVVFALAIAALLVAIVVGLMRRNRVVGRSGRAGLEGPNTVAQWTEGETTRLLSSAELPGLYLLRPRFLTKAESVVYLLLKAAFPRHEIFARIRLADVLQVKIGPQGMERLRAFRKIANQHVGFVVCDRDMTIVAIVDSKEPDQVINPRDQKLEIIKQRCLQAAQVKYLCVYPPQLPRYRELREQILGPAGDLV